MTRLMSKNSTLPVQPIFLFLTLILLLSGCVSTQLQVANPDPVSIPILKNSANECYYLDDFMPVPDGLVTGKSGNLDLRYYTYKSANYKEWRFRGIMLSFYSRNGQCWSLFEEYYIAE